MNRRLARGLWTVDCGPWTDAAAVRFQCCVQPWLGALQLHARVAVVPRTSRLAAAACMTSGRAPARSAGTAVCASSTEPTVFRELKPAVVLVSVPRPEPAVAPPGRRAVSRRDDALALEFDLLDAP